jgi:membrane protease YdiL (CAAX protease family)
MKSKVIQQSHVEPATGGAVHRAVADDRAAHDAHRRAGGVRGAVRRHPLAAFFVIAFALTWCTIPIGAFMAAGPLLGALIVLGITEGRPGIRALGRRMVQWRVRWTLYVAAVAVPLGVALAAGGLNVALGAPEGAFTRLELSTLALTFALKFVIPVFAPLGEEPGWRGFALPRLLVERSPAVATLFLGVVVAIWHVPLIWMQSEHLEPVMLLGTLAVTFFYTWLFVHADGSVFITIVAHAADGVVGRELIGDHGWGGSNEARFSLLYTGGWCVVAVVLLLADRRMWWTRPASATPTDHDAQPAPPAPTRRAATVAKAAGLALVAAAAIAVTVPAAGASGASVHASGGAERSAYIERGDGICRRTVARVDAVVEGLGLDPSDADARAAADRIVTLSRSEVRRLRALTPPAGDARRLDRLYDAVERGIERIADDPERLFDEPGPMARVTRLARDYGFEVCGRG